MDLLLVSATETFSLIGKIMTFPASTIGRAIAFRLNEAASVFAYQSSGSERTGCILATLVSWLDGTMPGPEVSRWWPPFEEPTSPEFAQDLGIPRATHTLYESTELGLREASDTVQTVNTHLSARKAKVDSDSTAAELTDSARMDYALELVFTSRK